MNNSGIKVLLVILIVICLFQGCGLASMSDEIDGLNNYISGLQSDVRDLAWRVDDLESMMENDGLQLDVSYGIANVDWNKGVVVVEFSIGLGGVTEHTSLSISNGYSNSELTRSGSQFVGNIEYPMNEESYDTIVYQYDSGSIVASETIDSIDAGMLLSKYILCEFDGLASYGNGRLTLAGTVDYVINIQEKVTSTKLVLVDEEIELQNQIQGSKEINLSKEVDVSTEDMRQFYIEVVAESGLIYRMYPNVYAYPSYQVNIDEEKFESAYQENRLVVITPAGTTYDMILFAE